MAFLYILLSVFLALPAYGAENNCQVDCTEMEEQLKQIAQQWSDVWGDVYDHFVKPPDLEGLESCLDTIENFSVDIAINIPSFGSIIDGALERGCQAIKDKATSVLDEASSSFNIETLGIGVQGEAGFGSDESGLNFSINDTSSEVLNTLFDHLK